ncbi:MAG: glucose-6-phosphate dehydrogenase [Chlamydiales bacterium]|nr:glucose-6-phosphate dehydrogenase [Chlamydiales bacterium]
MSATKVSVPFHNPFQEGATTTKIAAPCIVVIFGATGDLTRRRLVPALYNLARDGQLPAHFCCVGFARRPKSDAEFRKEMYGAINEFSRVKPVDENLWKSFGEQLFYHQSEFDEDEGYETLAKQLQDLDVQFGTKGNRVYYFSTQPRYFPTLVKKLKKHGLIYPHGGDNSSGPWSRIIFEKPFGHDLPSAIALQDQISKYLDESQTYRIDHWLGKETVQNLLVFRFTNPIFEALWNRHHIDHVQIAVAEDLGVGTRGALWEEQGMLRDIVQNHMMQLLSLIAMEPPSKLDAEAIRDEKVKVISSITPISAQEFDKCVVRGQYGPGMINGKDVCGYRQEANVSATSAIETFVALKLHIDNWRWAGVPFYLRSGKRLPKKVTEIAITFKEAPGHLYQEKGRPNPSNVLAIRIQPDENISLTTNCKVPGQENLVHPVRMDFRYNAYFGAAQQEAYERLICDCMAGDSTLFARDDEVQASWRLLTPILERWQATKPANFPNYPAGKWGPLEAEAMMAADGRQWRLL